jgi:hypothetical protein
MVAMRHVVGIGSITARVGPSFSIFGKLSTLSRED